MLYIIILKTKCLCVYAYFISKSKQEACYNKNHFKGAGLLLKCCTALSLFTCRSGKAIAFNSRTTLSSYLSHVTRKTVFGVCDLNRPAQLMRLAKGLEISATASRGIILSRQRATRALIKLPLLFAHGINTFSHDVALLNCV